MNNLLEIADLSVSFASTGSQFNAVENVNLSLKEGEILSIVGESGSGKSVSMLAMMGLLPNSASVKAEHMRFKGQDLMSPADRRQIIGKDIAMIFQEPFASLNPCFTVGYQISEVLRYHLKMNKQAAYRRAQDLLASVGVTDPRRRLSSYPHQLSGGICQRVGIAMALACEPSLLIADEPTTALDVSIQAQILELLLKLQRERKMALILITHDLGVVAEVAERVMVFYAGSAVEAQSKTKLLQNPHHPYTKALLEALPEHYGNRYDGGHIKAIAGVVPGHHDRPSGCLFHPRCDYAKAKCRTQQPQLSESKKGAAYACHYPLNVK